MSATGLYTLKPWYARRLTGVRRGLVAHGIHPDLITWAGVGCGAAAGLVLALLTERLPTVIIAAVVALALVLRLAAANLDGGVARETGRGSRWGSVVNELGDRLADVAALSGLLTLTPPVLAVAAIAAATLPSWVSLAGAAAGAQRINTGPMGKTERCLALVVVAALPSMATPIAAVILVGSVVTAVVRGVRVHAQLADAA